MCENCILNIVKMFNCSLCDVIRRNFGSDIGYDKNNLIKNNHSSFRKRHSCEIIIFNV